MGERCVRGLLPACRAMGLYKGVPLLLTFATTLFTLVAVGSAAPTDFDQAWNENQAVPETQGFDLASLLIKPIVCKCTNAFKLSQKTPQGKKVLAGIEKNSLWKKFGLGKVLKSIKAKNQAKENKQVAKLMKNPQIMQLMPLMNLFLKKMAKFNGGMVALTAKLQKGC